MPKRTRKKSPRGPTFKINDQIEVPELRVLDDAGENLGVLKLDEAISKARETGLDLVLVTESARPPVARITSFDKFRYQKEKEFKKQNQQKAPEIKRVQISPREAQHDLAFKLKRLEGFLQEGNKVEIQVTLRGREKGMKDFAKGKLQEFIDQIETPFKVSQEVRPGGRGLTTELTPK